MVPAFSRDGQCTGKRAHASQKDAVAHVISLRRDQGARLQAYHCVWCHHWHIGAPPDRKRFKGRGRGGRR